MKLQCLGAKQTGSLVYYRPKTSHIVRKGMLRPDPVFVFPWKSYLDGI